MIETLKDDSQILLLYLAGELPDEDRHAIGNRLIAEPQLAQELDQLRTLYGDIAQRLEHADELTAPPINVNAVSRSIGREMRRRLVAGIKPAPLKQPEPRRALRPWLIPSAVAAAILLAGGLWIVHSQNLGGNKELVVRPPAATLPTNSAPSTDEKLALFQASFNTPNSDIDDLLTGKDTTTHDDVSPYLMKVGTVQE